MSVTSFSVQEGMFTPVSNAPSTYKPKCECGHADVLRRCAIGSVLILAISSSWVALTYFAKTCYQEDQGFQAPFVIVYFSSASMILFFPAYIAAVFVYSKGESTPASIFSDSVRVFNKDHFNIRSFSAKTIVFCTMWTATNYLYMRALVILSVTDITALFSTNQSFVYMLSWIALFEKFVAVRIIAMIFSITGIVLFAYVGSDKAFDSVNMLGVILTVGAAAGAAIYKVLFKKYVGDATYGQVTLFLTTVGLSVVLLTWPIPVILYFTRLEQIEWNTLPLLYLCSVALLTLVYQFMVNLAVTTSYPVFVGLGVVAAIPIAAGSDILWYKTLFPGMKLAGIILIGIGLLIVILPDNWFDRTLRVLSLRRNDEPIPATPISTRRRSRFLSISHIPPHVT